MLDRASHLLKNPLPIQQSKKFLEGHQGLIVNSLRDGLPKRKTNPWQLLMMVLVISCKPQVASGFEQGSAIV